MTTKKKQVNKQKMLTAAVKKVVTKPKVRTEKEALYHILKGVVNSGTVCPCCGSNMRMLFSEVAIDDSSINIDFFCDTCKTDMNASFRLNA